jgi:hypothetical protein
MGCLVQAHAGLHRVDQYGVEREQPERRRAHRLGAREARLRLGVVAGRRRGAAVRDQPRVLRAAHQQEPGGQEADDEDRGTDRHPAIAPAAALHGELRDQRQHHQAADLRQGGDRGHLGATRHEPAIECAVEAKIERPGPVHPREAEQQIEHQQ